MLRDILSITGKPGLYRLLTQGRNSIIVEDITSKKRMAALGRDKIVSLGDIAMYTDNGDKPLGEILDLLYAKQEGKPVDVKALSAKKGGLRELFGEVLNDFDQDRVHDSDIKKLFSWYNLLVNAGFDKFTKDEEKKEDEKQEESSEA